MVSTPTASVLHHQCCTASTHGVFTGKRRLLLRRHILHLQLHQLQRLVCLFVKHKTNSLWLSLKPGLSTAAEPNWSGSGKNNENQGLMCLLGHYQPNRLVYCDISTLIQQKSEQFIKGRPGISGGGGTRAGLGLCAEIVLISLLIPPLSREKASRSPTQKLGSSIIPFPRTSLKCRF